VIGLVLLLVMAIVSALGNLCFGSLLFFCFSAANACFFLYGFWRLIGWREALTDVKAGIGLGSIIADPAGDLELVEEPGR
jgi:hypothetical protein